MTNHGRRALATAGIAGVLGLTGVLAPGCSAPARPAASASSPSAAPASGPAFESAKAECKQRAVAATEDTRQQGIASKAAVGLYVDCMRQKGFDPGTGPN